MDDLADISEDSWQLHVPGQNFTGPGTHIVEKLRAGVMPNNKTDFVTMLHDIDYLANSGRDPMLSDMYAMEKSDWSMVGVTTKYGLATKMVLARILGTSDFNTALKGKTPEQTRAIGNRLVEFVLTDQNYAALFEKYDIDPHEWLSTHY